MEDYLNAITYLSEAMIIMKRYGNRQAETQVYANLGKAYRRMRNYPDSVKYYNRALKYYREISDRSSVAHTLCEMGELYFELNDFRSSKLLFAEGLEISKEIKDSVNEVRIHTGLARLYVKFHETERAETYLHSAKELAKARNAYKELSLIFKLNSELYGISGDLKSSKENLDKYYYYMKKLSDIAEENRLQALMLGHFHGGINNDDTIQNENLTADNLPSENQAAKIYLKPALKFA